MFIVAVIFFAAVASTTAQSSVDIDAVTQAFLTPGSYEDAEEGVLFDYLMEEDGLDADTKSLRAAVSCPIYGKAASDKFDFQMLNKCIETKDRNYNFQLHKVNPIAPQPLCPKSGYCKNAVTLKLYEKGVCFMKEGIQVFSTVSMVANVDAQVVIGCSAKCPFSFKYNSIIPNGLAMCLPASGYVCSSLLTPFCKKNMSS